MQRRNTRPKIVGNSPRVPPGKGIAWLTAALLSAILAGGFAKGPQPTRIAKSALHPPKATGMVTFAKDVAPILYRNCTTCHRTGEVAPFTLSSYQDAKKRARQIAAVTHSRFMPPWKADSHGEFQDERRLSDAQIATLKRWAEAGAPLGNPKHLPPAPKFASGWALGKPDLVLEPSAAYTVSADGNDVYRCFVVPTDFPEDRYVSAIDVRPGNRAVVHHMIAYLDTSGTARKRDAADPAPGYGGGLGFLPAGMLGGWAPGAMPHPLPPDTGLVLPKGADVVLEVHYHKDGKPETDLTKVAVYFNKGPVARPLHLFPLVNTGIRIPPGDKNYEARASIPVLFNTTLYTIFPHMHMLGRQMTVTATLPDGTRKTLIDVPDWDFNWQGFYAYKQPVKLPRGSHVDLVAHYDNSADNLRNPNDPPKTVTWGEQTTDEMCLAFLGFTVDAEHVRAARREMSRTSSQSYGPFSTNSTSSR